MKGIISPYNGSDWVKHELGVNDMSDIGVVVADILGVVFKGIYHIQKPVCKADWKNPRYIKIILNQDLATWDFNFLTQLVVICHDCAVRMLVTPKSSLGYYELLFSPRDENDENQMSGHPSIEKHIQTIRSHYKIAKGGNK